MLSHFVNTCVSTLFYFVRMYAKSTESKCRWAVRLFNDWKSAWNEIIIREPSRNLSMIRAELLEMTKDELCYARSRFIPEVKKQSGDDYPAETLYEIVISIQLYLSTNGREMNYWVTKSSYH